MLRLAPCAMKILVIEASERLRRSLGEGLRRLGHAVDLAADGEEGSAYAEHGDYDAIVLDLMLPRRPGLEVLERLRQRGREVHVLVLSAKDRVEDRVRGLAAGADYLVKPFSFEELGARLAALGRRRYGAKRPVLEIGPLAIDTSRREVRRDGATLALTAKEYAVLEFLAYRRGRVFSQQRLIEALYPAGETPSGNAIEALVSTLRKKIDVPGEPPIVRTRRGFGYCVE